MVTRQGLSHHYSKVSMRLRSCDGLPTEGGRMQAAWILMFAGLQATAATPEQAIHKLKATPKTVAWGYYAASTANTAASGCPQPNFPWTTSCPRARVARAVGPTSSAAA